MHGADAERQALRRTTEQHRADYIGDGAGGLTPGTLFASTPAFAPNESTISTTAGLMQQGSALGQFVAPPIIALAVSSAGNWSVAWTVTGAMALANGGLALMIQRSTRA